MISSTEGEIMSAKKKTVKKESTPSNVQLAFHTKREIEAARKKLEKLKKLGEEIDPALANEAKLPGRPYKCLYPSNKRYHLKMPEIYYSFLKEKAEKENVPIRKLILDAVAKFYEKEIDKIINSYS
jgi:hypothetical protein